MKKYVIKRNEVMAGILKLVLPVETKTVSHNMETFDNYKGYVSVNARGVLFNIENNMAHDLMYDNPFNYYIEGRTDIHISNNVNYVITDYLELDNILKELKFNKDLTRSDLNKIFSMLVKHKNWLNKHEYLFSNETYELLKDMELVGYKINEFEPSYKKIKKTK